MLIMNKIIITEIKRTERTLWTILTVIVLALIAGATNAQTFKDWKQKKGEINVIMANDLGRNGYYDQKPIAETMGEVAGAVGTECIIAAGDIHHFNGVASVNDPLWMTNYESVYSHPELMTDWFPILGNHEYRGNTQAVMDYSKVSRRWMFRERYYSKTFNDEKSGTSLRIIFLDTTPLISRYRDACASYPDAVKQDDMQQMEWLDSTLSHAKEKWIVVVGHHPIYAQTNKDNIERTDMQKRLLPILHKYNNVAIYACGHIHNFQHIKMSSDAIDYVVNSSASLARNVKPTKGTVFCSNEPGFSVISATKESLRMYMVDKHGNILHCINR